MPVCRRPPLARGHDNVIRPFRLNVGRAALVHEPAIGIGAHDVDVGAGGHVGRLARADLEIDRRHGRAVDHVVAIAGVFLGKAAQSPAVNVDSAANGIRPDNTGV